MIRRSYPLQFGSVPFPLSGPQPLVLAGDDFDMDGVRMRWKGIKFQQLPDPTLIVVLAAPPTKKGISQNYGGSEMSYSTSHGYSTSYEVTRTKTLSLSGGFEAEDPTGWNGGGFKITVGGALSTSEDRRTRSRRASRSRVATTRTWSSSRERST